MASSPLKSNPQHHVRSISLPSRPHSLTCIDEQLSKLRAYEATSSSLSSIGNRLSVLEDVFDSLDEFLQVSNTQNALVKNEKWAEEVLDGYLRLLDLCVMAKDISSETKEDILGVLSILRRRRDRNKLESFLNSSKQTKKAIQKSLKDLKYIKTRRKNYKNEAMVSLFQVVEEANIVVLESLMQVAGSKPQSKLSVFINKRVLGKSLLSEDEANGFENVDIALDLRLNKKTDQLKDTVQIENVKKQLAETWLSVEDLEQGFECLFRRLITSGNYFLCFEFVRIVHENDMLALDP